jgi:hypothetical protein
LDGLEVRATFSDSNTGSIGFARSWLTVAEISLVVILYPILILFALFAFAPTSGSGNVLTREVLLASAALALTFLPLRQLFVPPDISGITRLDWMLVTALFAIVLGLLVDSLHVDRNITYLRLMQRLRNSRSRDQPSAPSGGGPSDG